MNAARVTVQAWTLGLRDVLAELGAARLLVVCGRVGLRELAAAVCSDAHLLGL